MSPNCIYFCQSIMHNLPCMYYFSVLVLFVFAVWGQNPGHCICQASILPLSYFPSSLSMCLSLGYSLVPAHRKGKRWCEEGHTQRLEALNPQHVNFLVRTQLQSHAQCLPLSSFQSKAWGKNFCAVLLGSPVPRSRSE